MCGVIWCSWQVSSRHAALSADVDAVASERERQTSEAVDARAALSRIKGEVELATAELRQLEEHVAAAEQKRLISEAAAVNFLPT
jgi:predicted  nucleic acid-binding Zn-ribbon protein